MRATAGARERARRPGGGAHDRGQRPARRGRAPARRRRRRPHRPSPRARSAEPGAAPATSSSPTTPRRCRPAWPARTSRRRRADRGAAGRAPLAGVGSACARFVAVVFGAGDHRTPTEHRPPPPPLHAGDRLRLGPLDAVVERVLGHPRLIELRFDGSLERRLERHRPARPSDPVRARAAAAGACGRRGRGSPACRWRSSRRRPASCSTGPPCSGCAIAARRWPR